MPPVVAQQNDCFQVNLVGRMEGQETNNIMHFRCVSGAGDGDTELHLIQVLLTCFITHVLPVLTSAWTLEKIVWKRVSPTLGPEFVSLPEGPAVGGGNAAALPSFASALFSKRTDQGGRSKRGRMYLAGIPENATLGSSLDPSHAFWAGMLAFAVCIIENFTINDPPGSDAWVLCVYSRKIGGDNFPYGLGGFEAITDFTPNLQIATTRSRKVGRGS